MKKTAAMAQLFGEAFEVRAAARSSREKASEELMRYRESFAPHRQPTRVVEGTGRPATVVISCKEILMYTSHQSGIRKSFQHCRRHCFCATQCTTTWSCRSTDSSQEEPWQALSTWTSSLRVWDEHIMVKCVCRWVHHAYSVGHCLRRVRKLKWIRCYCFW